MRKMLLIAGVIVAAAAIMVWAAVPSTLNDFFMPGSQPGQSGNLEHPNKCDNCHGGYNIAVEPAFNWRGSMMAQAARDPLFYACMAIANQDAPESGDLCIRCHSPAGWLEGRSVPTDGTALNNNDREGVQCDFCHKLVKPTPLGVNPYPDDPDYTAGTYTQDQTYLATITAIPPTSANGMYVCDANNAKRGPFVDAAARHQMFYSPFHKEAAICGTCHDVSNPAFTKQPDGSYAPNDFDAASPSFEPYQMLPIERTYSEWLNSEYNTPTGVYAPQFGGNKQYVSTCQDCHMHDVTGVAANKNGAVNRTDLPLHDLTGGNTFIPRVIDAAFPGETNPDALAAGIDRARSMLQKAASMNVTLTDNGTGYTCDVRVTNETAHKLPSGYPEGRRIWLNVLAYDLTGQLVYESGGYDFNTAVLTHDADAKIYETHPGLSTGLAAALGYEPGQSFHFVLNDSITIDNRIPPRGFTNAAFAAIQSPPIGYSYADGQYWDDTQYSLPAELSRVEVTLYYQATSKEFVEFLRDENITNDWGTRFYQMWLDNGMSTPEVMQQEIIVLQQIADTEPPTAPSSLTATTKSFSQIDLSWTASTDNVGVAGYTIYRDGAMVGTTTGTSYTDGGLSPSTTYSYYVTAYDAAGNTSTASNTASATTDAKKGGKPPRKLVASFQDGIGVYPNPFNPSTELSYTLAVDEHVLIQVYNISGQRVATLVDKWQTKGEHSVSWDASTFASGVYLFTISAGEDHAVKKAVLMK